jgi:DNA-directed RNA polymerase specialized sigma24 family protein
MTDELISKDEQLEIACGLLDKDERALLRLLETYGPKLKWLLKKKFGGVLNECDVNSCVLYAAAKAWNSPYDDAKGTLGGWFYTIACNAAKDMVRGQKNEPKRSLRLEWEPTLPPRVPACLDENENSDPVIQDLMQEVMRLGTIQRTIAEADLLAEGEADAEALAKKLGIPKQSVYSYRNKYRAALLERMKRRGHTAAGVARRTR